MHFSRTSNFEEFAVDVAWVRQPAAISSFIIVHFPPSPIFAPSLSSFMSTFIFVAPTLLCVFAFIYKLINAYACFMCVQICVCLCEYVHKSVDDDFEIFNREVGFGSLGDIWLFVSRQNCFQCTIYSTALSLSSIPKDFQSRRKLWEFKTFLTYMFV